MDKIVVSGQLSGIGKSSFIEKIIPGLCGEITVVKTSINESVEETVISIEEDEDKAPNKDTGRYLKAGANKAVYVKSDIKKLNKSIDDLDNLVNDSDYLIYESNSILNFIQPDLLIYLRDNDMEKKLSAKMAEKRADLIIDKAKKGFKIEDIIFNQDKISCYKAHLVAEVLGESVGKIGRLIDSQRIKVKGCQLGLF